MNYFSYNLMFYIELPGKYRVTKTKKGRTNVRPETTMVEL